MVALSDCQKKEGSKVTPALDAENTVEAVFLNVFRIAFAASLLMFFWEQDRTHVRGRGKQKNTSFYPHFVDKRLTQYVVFAHWMLCCLVGYVERRGPYLP